MVAVGVQNTEDPEPEPADFSSSAAVPVACHRHVGHAADNAASRTAVGEYCIAGIENAVAVGIQYPQEPGPEEADLGGATSGPVTGHRDVACEAAVVHDHITAIEDAVAVQVEEPLARTRPVDPDFGSSGSGPVTGHRNVACGNTREELELAVSQTTVERSVVVEVEKERARRGPVDPDLRGASAAPVAGYRDVAGETAQTSRGVQTGSSSVPLGFAIGVQNPVELGRRRSPEDADVRYAGAGDDEDDLKRRRSVLNSAAVRHHGAGICARLVDVRCADANVLEVEVRRLYWVGNLEVNRIRIAKVSRSPRGAIETEPRGNRRDSGCHEGHHATRGDDIVIEGGRAGIAAEGRVATGDTEEGEARQRNAVVVYPTQLRELSCGNVHGKRGGDASRAGERHRARIDRCSGRSCREPSRVDRHVIEATRTSEGRVYGLFGVRGARTAARKLESAGRQGWGKGANGRSCREYYRVRRDLNVRQTRDIDLCRLGDVAGGETDRNGDIQDPARRSNKAQANADVDAGAGGVDADVLRYLRTGHEVAEAVDSVCQAGRVDLNGCLNRAGALDCATSTRDD